MEVDEADDSCPRGGETGTIDPLGCTLWPCHSLMDVLGDSYDVGRILKATHKSEEKKNQCEPPDTPRGFG